MQNSLKVMREKKRERERERERESEGIQQVADPKGSRHLLSSGPGSLLSPNEEGAPISISWQTYIALFLGTYSTYVLKWPTRGDIKARNQNDLPLPFMPLIQGPPESRIKSEAIRNARWKASQLISSFLRLLYASGGFRRVLFIFF